MPVIDYLLDDPRVGAQPGDFVLPDGRNIMPDRLHQTFTQAGAAAKSARYARRTTTRDP